MDRPGPVINGHLQKYVTCKQAFKSECRQIDPRHGSMSMECSNILCLQVVDALETAGAIGLDSDVAFQTLALAVPNKKKRRAPVSVQYVIVDVHWMTDLGQWRAYYHTDCTIIFFIVLFIAHE